MASSKDKTAPDEVAPDSDEQASEAAEPDTSEPEAEGDETEADKAEADEAEADEAEAGDSDDEASAPDAPEAEAAEPVERPKKKKKRRRKVRRDADGNPIKRKRRKAKGAKKRAKDDEEAKAAKSAEPEDEEEVASFWEDFRDFYLTFDRRTLGLARIMLGFFLLFDLFRRTQDWWKMYSDQGVLPTHYNLWRPQSGGFSIFNAFSSVDELWVLWTVGLCIYLCVLVGFKTRIAQVLAAIFVASMNGRILLIENGGYVVHNLLLLWTAFLPMGDRFSVDALLKSFKNQSERSVADLNNRDTDTARWRLTPHVTILGLVLVLQLAAIYGFNWKHKTGRSWHDGTGVHYVLWVDRMVTPLIAEVREHIPRWIIKILTYSVMGAEAGLPIALLSPLARTWAKRLAIGGIFYLHIGFGSTFVLGPFAWALCVFAMLLFSREDWELGIRTMRRSHRARIVRYDPRARASFFWCRLLKRLDNFKLLSFEEDDKARGLEVTRPDGERVRGHRATAEILCALPGGPVIGGPMKLPVLQQLFGLFAWLLSAVVRFSFPSRPAAAVPADQLTPYQPELKDDADHPTIDGYYMRDWFRDFYEERILGMGQWWAGIACTLIGGFLWVYSTDLLRKLEDESLAKSMIATVKKGTWSPLEWGGLVLMIAGLLLFVRPFWSMNLSTPAPVSRKWLRMTAGLREAFIVVMFAGAINQALVELWVFRPFKFPQPAVMRVLSHKFRYLQGWFMFSPNPVMDDGVLVVDAITVDGRRVDPFRDDTYDYKLAPADFDLPKARSYAYNQIWSDYFNRMHLPANTSFRKPMKEYMYRLHERTGNPDDAIVKGVVYWSHDMNPRFGRTNSYNYGRKELFKFTNPDKEVQRRYRENTGGEDPPPLPVPEKRDMNGNLLNESVDDKEEPNKNRSPVPPIKQGGKSGKSPNKMKLDLKKTRDLFKKNPLRR